MQLDEALIRQFIEALTGDPDGLVCWQIFDDSKRKRAALARCWHGRLDLDVLRLHQEEGCGVFVAVNETNGTERKAATIKTIRSVFCDNDGVQIAPVLPPSFWTITARGENPYWLATGPVPEFSYVQSRLARFYNTDKAVKDPSRVMRVPGTLHLKGEPKLVGFRPGSGARYTFAEILAAHDLPEPAPPDTRKFRLVRASRAWVESRGKIIRQKASERSWAEGSRHASLLETLTHARKFWLPDDHTRSIAYEYGSPAGLPDREIEKVLEWVLVSVDTNPDDDPALRAAAVTTASSDPEPDPEPLPDPIAKAYMEIFELESPTLRAQKIKEVAKQFGIPVLTIKQEIRAMEKRDADKPKAVANTWEGIDLAGLPWSISWKGVVAVKLMPGGFGEVLENDIVATRPIWPAALGEDISTKEPYVFLKWFDQYDVEKSQWFRQTTLRDRDTLKSIPGACIGASRVNKISDYLADAEARVKDTHRRLTAHLGWVKDSWVWSGSTDPQYLGDPLPEAGDLEKWLVGFRHLLAQGEAGYPGLICLAASAGSPLVRLAGRRNPVLALACRTSTGKGTVINYAISLWTDPSLLTLPASSTIKGTQDRAMLLPDAPLFVDELHQTPEEDLHKLLYFLGNGQRRVTSSVNQKAIGGQRRYGFGFAAGEMELTTGGHGGIGTRVIELKDSPLPDAESASILRDAARYHSAAGMLISALLTPDRISMLEAALVAVRKRCSELQGDDENALAIIWAGAWLLCEALGFDQDWIKPAMEWLIVKHSEARKNHVDKIDAAWEDIVDTVTTGQREKGILYVASERIGWYENPIGTFDFLPQHPRIVQIAHKAGGAYKLFAAFAARGLIIRGAGKNIKVNRRDGDVQVSVIRAAPKEEK